MNPSVPDPRHIATLEPASTGRRLRMLAVVIGCFILVAGVGVSLAWQFSTPRKAPSTPRQDDSARKRGTRKIPKEWLNLSQIPEDAARLHGIQRLAKLLQSDRKEDYAPSEIDAALWTLCQGTWDRDPAVAKAALEALGLTGARVKDSVFVLLRFPEGDVAAGGPDARSLASAIAQGGEKVIPALLEAVNDDDYEIRARAAYALRVLAQRDDMRRDLVPHPDGPPGTFAMKAPKKAEAFYAALDGRRFRLSQFRNVKPNSPERFEGILTLLETLHEKGEPDGHDQGGFLPQVQAALENAGPLRRVALPDVFRSEDQSATWIAQWCKPDEEDRKPAPAGKPVADAVLKERLHDDAPAIAFEAALELARRNIVDREVFDALLRIHLPQKLRPGVVTPFPDIKDDWHRQLLQLRPQTQKTLCTLGRPVLRSDDATKRRAAAWLLAPFDAEACLPVLLASLKENRDMENPEFSKTVTTLARLGPKARSAFAPLREQMKIENKANRFYGRSMILNALARIDAEAALPLLIKAWREPPQHPQQQAFFPELGDLDEVACQLLRELGPRARSLLPSLLDDLKKPGTVGKWTPAFRNPPGPWAAANLLVSIGPAAVPPMQELLGHADTDHQLKAAWVLGEIGAGAKSAVPALLKLLAVKDAKVRRQAAVALHAIDPGNASVVAALIALRSDPDVEVRRWLVHALAGAGDKGMPTLIESLKDADAEVRLGAAGTLGHLGVRALPALREALKHKDVQVRRAAVLAFGNLAPETEGALAALMEASRDSDKLTRRLALSLLDRPGEATAQVVPVLVKALADEDAGVRWTAAFVLEELEPKAADVVPALKLRLKDEDADVRRRVRFALRAIDPLQKIEDD